MKGQLPFKPSPPLCHMKHILLPGVFLPSWRISLPWSKQASLKYSQPHCNAALMFIGFSSHFEMYGMLLSPDKDAGFGSGAPAGFVSGAAAVCAALEFIPVVFEFPCNETKFGSCNCTCSRCFSTWEEIDMDRVTIRTCNPRGRDRQWCGHGRVFKHFCACSLLTQRAHHHQGVPHIPRQVQHPSVLLHTPSDATCRRLRLRLTASAGRGHLRNASALMPT